MIRITQCGIENINALQAISRQTFFETFKESNTEHDMNDYLDHAYSIDQLTDEISNNNSKFFFLTNKDELAGYLKINVEDAQTENYSNDFMEIQRIYIKQSFQKQGFGEKLLNKAFSTAKQMNKKQIWLGVWSENEQARKFYMKQGFVDYAEHEFTLGTSKQTDIIMIKEVEE